MMKEKSWTKKKARKTQDTRQAKRVTAHSIMVYLTSGLPSIIQTKNKNSQLSFPLFHFFEDCQQAHCKSVVKGSSNPRQQNFSVKETDVVGLTLELRKQKNNCNADGAKGCGWHVKSYSTGIPLEIMKALPFTIYRCSLFSNIQNSKL